VIDAAICVTEQPMCVPNLQRAGARFSDQTPKAPGTRKALGAHRAKGHRPSVVDVLHA
jgi:hypothetical protein